MKTTFFPWTSAWLSAVLLASGCATSRHGVTHAYRPAVATDSIANRELSTTPDADYGTASNDDVVESPKGGSNSDGLNDPESNDIVPAGFAVHEPLAVWIADSDEGSIQTDQTSVHSESSGWSLAQLESTALQQNPAILQASSSAHKAYGYRNQVGLKPNPVIGYQGQQLADAGTDQHLAFVEQDIVMGDKLRKNQAVLNQEIQSQLWEVETQRIRVLTDVRQRFYEALAAQRRKELATGFETVAEKGVRFAEARMRAKEGTRPEVLQAEIQLKEVQLQRRNAEAAFRGAWKQLMAVAGMPDMQQGTLDGQLSVATADRDWDNIQTQILSSSPELQGARARFARARANLDRQQSQAIPNLSLMLGAGQDNGTGSSFINTQIGLPVPIHNKNQGNIAAAHAEFCRTSHDVHRTENSIQSRLAQARRDFEVSAATVLQYEQEILPRAQETLTLAESAYEAGEFDFLQVLIVRRTYFESNLAYVTAQVELARSAALVDGSVLSGGLESTRDTEFDSALRDQSLTGQ
ncbi:MAG: TolC family protein [Planctomycetota bacterium]|nr:TolC family protein [Planctomycetota bacterium]